MHGQDSDKLINLPGEGSFFFTENARARVVIFEPVWKAEARQQAKDKAQYCKWTKKCVSVTFRETGVHISVNKQDYSEIIT